MDPTSRFSTRVDDYITSRPRYPQRVVRIIEEASGLTPRSIVADVGSGTGILTELFLRNGNDVFGVEPNRAMREAGERLLSGFPRFHSIDGRAEATTLPDRSVDVVSAGQAFHWFDRERTRSEFLRILKPAGWVVLVWNERITDTTPFLRAYEALLTQYGTDYAQVDHRRIDELVLAAFFGRDGFTSSTLGNRQELDYAGLQGRLLSSSYAPQVGHPNAATMLAALAAMFQEYQHDGRVEFDYATKVYCGRLA